MQPQQPQYPSEPPRWYGTMGPPPVPGPYPAQLPQAPAGPRNGVAVAGLVCGLVAAVLCIVGANEPIISAETPLMIGGGAAVAGIVCAGVALGRVRRGEASGKAMVRWGLWVSIAALVASVALYSAVENKLQDARNCLNAVSHSLDNLGDQSAQQAADAACHR